MKTIHYGIWGALVFYVGLSLNQSIQADTDKLLKDLRFTFGNRFWLRSPEEQFGLDWTNDPFKVVPSISIAKKEVESKFSSGKADTEAAVKNYKHQAALNQDNPSILYSWAYASIKQSSIVAQEGRNYWQEKKHLEDLGTMVWLMAATKKGVGYEYVRMRFILEAGLTQRKDLMTLGYRLLARNPQDEAVLRTLADQLSFSHREVDLDEGLKLADLLLKKHPSKLSYIGLKGILYQSRWYALGKRAEDGRRMIEWDKKYIALAPTNCPGSKGKQRMINLVRTELGID